MRPAAIQRAHRSSEDGFTLIEALIAVSLLSLLSVLVVGALRFGVNAWQRNQDITLRLDEIVHAQNFLRRTIANAHPYFVIVPGGKGYVDFEGSPQSITWLSDPPASLDRAGRLLLRIEFRSENGNQDLVVATRPELAPGGNTSDTTVRSLLNHLESATFSYYGSKEPNAPAEWHAHWIKEASLPELIRLDTVPSDDREWPPIFIRPRINIDISCIYDSLTGRCRGR
jgi:general secretion pathway protein J